MSPAPYPSPGAVCALLGVLLAALLLGLEFLARPWVVVGESMAPSLRGGDRVLVDVWTYRRRVPRPREIVLFRPAPGSAAVVKRVSRLVASPTGDGEALWLLGDNPRDSLDSRHLGPVGTDRVVGRVVLRFWPIRIHEFP